MIMLWLHRQFLSTLDRTQQVSWFDFWQWMKWIHLYDPETQEQSEEGRNSASPHPKSFKHISQSPRCWHLFSGKNLGFCRFTTSKRVQQSQPARLSWTKWSMYWSLNCVGSCQKEGLFLQDTTSSHTAAITQRKLADLHFEVCWNSLPIHLIWPILTTICSQTWKKHLKGMKFSSTEDVMPAADNCFAAQPSEFCLDGLKKLQQWVRVVLNSGRSVFNKEFVWNL